MGAGPAGLAAAIALARLGVETMLVERRAELSSLPRATAVSLRSMELIRSWGVEDAVRAGGVDVEWHGWLSDTLATVADGSMWPTGIPTREQAALLSPTAPACVPQDHLEPVLLEHLRSPRRHPRSPPHRGGEGRATGRRASRSCCATSRAANCARVRARYLVAADGARSPIRRAARDRHARTRRPWPRRHGDLPRAAVAGRRRAPLRRLLRQPPGRRGHLPARPVAATAGTTGPGSTPHDIEGYTPQRFARRIRAGAGIDDLDVSVERTGAFSFAAQLADRFRAGNVFLAGDAAHRVTPRGGTGMNTAIGSGHDLGWKLGWVLRGWAGPELLDTYEAERRPVAAHNVARSADPDGSTRDAADELHVDLGGRIPHVWVRIGRRARVHAGPPGPRARRCSPGPTTPSGTRCGRPVARRSPSARLDAVSARSIGIRGRGALLVRPDGAPAQLWTHDASVAA